MTGLLYIGGINSWCLSGGFLFCFFGMPPKPRQYVIPGVNKDVELSLRSPADIGKESVNMTIQVPVNTQLLQTASLANNPALGVSMEPEAQQSGPEGVNTVVSVSEASLDPHMDVNLDGDPELAPLIHGQDIESQLTGLETRRPYFAVVSNVLGGMVSMIPILRNNPPVRDIDLEDAEGGEGDLEGNFETQEGLEASVVVQAGSI